MNEPILTKSRQVSHCPPHFIKVPVHAADGSLSSMLSSLNNLSVQQRVRNHLHENIENRFYIGYDSKQKGGMMVETLTAAFEDPSDATYFSLVLQSLLD